jgi:ATP-dependent helicase YprA (DUF1998 family)
MTLTPSQNYARTKSLGKFPKTRKFAESFPFELDPFQVEACHALENGKGVLVAAPTGAGKTIVGEFAVDLVIGSGGKCFYTTPIKALSNQKFAELTEKYGEKTFTRISMIGEERFGKKTDLRIKFLQSVIEGYLKPDEIWTSDESINLLKEKIESTPDDKKEKLLLEILDTYDSKDPKIKLLLRRYSNILSKPEKISIAI